MPKNLRVKTVLTTVVAGAGGEGRPLDGSLPVRYYARHEHAFELLRPPLLQHVPDHGLWVEAYARLTRRKLRRPTAARGSSTSRFLFSRDMPRARRCPSGYPEAEARSAA